MCSTGPADPPTCGTVLLPAAHMHGTWHPSSEWTGAVLRATHEPCSGLSGRQFLERCGRQLLEREHAGEHTLGRAQEQEPATAAQAAAPPLTQPAASHAPLKKTHARHHIFVCLQSLQTDSRYITHTSLRPGRTDRRITNAASHTHHEYSTISLFLAPRLSARPRNQTWPRRRRHGRGSTGRCEGRGLRGGTSAGRVATTATSPRPTSERPHCATTAAAARHLRHDPRIRQYQAAVRDLRQQPPTRLRRRRSLGSDGRTHTRRTEAALLS